MVQQIEEDTGTLPASLPRGVAPEVAANNADVQAIIVPRLTMLMEIANTFLATIIESMESVPYGIRWICKQIRSLTRVSAISCGGRRRVKKGGRHGQSGRKDDGGGEYERGRIRSRGEGLALRVLLHPRAGIGLDKGVWKG